MSSNLPKDVKQWVYAQMRPAVRLDVTDEALRTALENSNYNVPATLEACGLWFAAECKKNMGIVLRRDFPDITDTELNALTVKYQHDIVGASMEMSSLRRQQPVPPIAGSE